MVRLTDDQMIAVGKAVCYNLQEEMAHRTTWGHPYKEIPGWVRRQKEPWENIGKSFHSGETMETDLGLSEYLQQAIGQREYSLLHDT